MIKRLLFPILLVLTIASASADKGVPVKELFRKPEFSSFQVSPNGDYLAVLAPYERRANIHVIELSTMKITRITNITQTDIAGFDWITDDRIFFAMDNGGDEYFGLFAIDRDGGNPTTIMPLLSDDASFSIPRYTQVIDKLDDQPDFVLVANNERRADYPDLYILDIHTGRKKIHLSNPGNVISWITDQNGVVRIGAIRDEKTTDSIRASLIYRSGPDDEFKQIVPFSVDDPKVTPLDFDYDGKTIYVLSRQKGEKTNGIYTYDPETQTLGDLIYRDDTYDAGGVWISDYTKKLSGYGIEREKSEIFWIDEEKAQIQKAMDDAFPDTINSPVSLSDDETVIVYASYSARQPAFYNLISLRGGTLKLTQLGHSREWIKPETMAEQEPFTIEARDGLTLHGYIWFPPNAKKRKNLPLIVNPHGGPNARDSYGWDPRVQFFTTRGFAVLQVNFRASEGYGYDFVKAGHTKWWTEMQYDIVDAVQWAIDQGYVDKKKIGIYGGSYGGYATMAQLVKYPELYNFGINVVGVVDTEEMLKYEKSTSDTAFAFWQSRIGKLDKDIDMVREGSPINHIENLDDPVFIIHGVRDPRVPIKQAELLRSAMKKHKKEFEWLIKRDEGHGFKKEENQFIEFEQVEDFIAPFMKKWGMN